MVPKAGVSKVQRFAVVSMSEKKPVHSREKERKGKQLVLEIHQ